MSDFETLKELKICYEYINDLLDNCDYISNEDYNTRNSLHKTLNVLQDLYSNCYEVMASNKESYEDLKMDFDCPHCSSKVNMSDLINYAYVCNDCDENYYLGEGDLGYAWYFDSANKQMKHKYIIEIWETEDDRDIGESFEYLETFDNKTQAIEKAKHIWNKNDYACIEVVDSLNNDSIFLVDSEEERYFYKDKEVSLVSKEMLNEYINKWTKKEELPISVNLLYCKDGNKYIAIDNSTNNCWVEEFSSEKEVQNWLLKKDLEGEIDYEI